MLTDTHCHLDLEQFDLDREAVIGRALQAGVERILIPATTLASSRAILTQVSQTNSRLSLCAAVGVHPTEAGSWETSTKRELKNLTQPPEGTNMAERKVVAIGEIGLDYYWKTAPHDLQQAVLREQLELAEELGLPVIIHMREAGDALTGPCSEDLLKILEEWVIHLKVEANPLAARPGVLHSFSGSLETARQAISLGFYIGVTGPVTFANARQRQDIVAQLPLDRLLTETDAPFLAPQPHRGTRNEPAYVRLIADKIALLHSRPTESIEEITNENASRLFQWK